jgi:hypothetical protein
VIRHFDAKVADMNRKLNKLEAAITDAVMDEAGNGKKTVH